MRRLRLRAVEAGDQYFINRRQAFLTNRGRDEEKVRIMFDLEVCTRSITQLRHILSGATVVLRNGTNEYEVTPGFGINADDHEAVAALVAQARKWIAEQSSPLRVALGTHH